MVRASCSFWACSGFLLPEPLPEVLPGPLTLVRTSCLCREWYERLWALPPSLSLALLLSPFSLSFSLPIHLDYPTRSHARTCVNVLPLRLSAKHVGIFSSGCTAEYFSCIDAQRCTKESVCLTQFRKGERKKNNASRWQQIQSSTAHAHECTFKCSS